MSGESRGAGRVPGVYRAQPGLSKDVLRVLGRRRSAVVGTLDADGSVHMTPVWFLFAEGRLYFETNSATRKARNVARSGSASMLLRGHAADASPLVVLARGTARVVEGERARELGGRIREKYLSKEGRGPVGRYLDRVDDVVIELEPVKWSSWAGAEMNREMRSLPEYEDGRWDEWFLPDEED